ncbi:unnamed protein product [Clonostachys rosea]|uniref:ABC transporter n=1 Tax=Bionectria ochroleuca TaxID=29856 RepID=A0ABY6V5V8_BIOOC|nr:unnamed protein product [Clonostachys rosea]
MEVSTAPYSWPMLRQRSSVFTIDEQSYSMEGMQTAWGGVPQSQTLFDSSIDAIVFASSILSLAVFSCHLLSGAIQKNLPQWLRPFAAETETPKARDKSRPVLWALILGFLSLSGFILAIVPIIILSHRLWAILEVVPWLVATLITALDRPVKTPRILLVQYFAMFMASVVICSVHFIHESLHSVDTFFLSRLAISCFALVAIINMPLRDPRWDADDIGKEPSQETRSPEDNTTLFQFWTMNWVYPLARICVKRDLAVEDVWQLPFDFQHGHLNTYFQELKGRLIPRLLRANGLDLTISASLAVVEKVSEVSNIRLTSELYAALDARDPNGAVFWCLVMLSVDCIRQVAKTTSSWYSRKAYERSRGETFIGLFSKLLTRAVPGSDTMERGPAEDNVLDDHESQQPQGRFRRFFSRIFGRKKAFKKASLLQSQPASNAKVVNLVRGDTYEISQRFWDFPRLISQPIKVIFTLYYLIDIMGWPSCVGVGLMLIFMSINSGLVHQLIKLERLRTALSDRRAQAVAHFVEASRPLKLNGWASTWSDRIMKFRDMEMMKRLHISYVNAAISTVNVLGGAAYPLASICLYTLVLRKGLPNEVIWPSLQLFGQLEISVKDAFDLISAYWKATIPVERVNRYMEEPDRDEDHSSSLNSHDIVFSNASFSWPSTSHLVLENINLSFTPGFTVIRGRVGSGKSSLLLAALNEMELHAGTLVRPNAPIGYTQQLPWLQNQTIRENIIFHQPYDQKRYHEVLDVCCLLQDLSHMRDGDQTRLEEGGIGLSGGQRARVALARVLYNSCGVLLLDDPLAALDHGTASRIVQRFLEGPLAKGRTIVMVTHRDDLVLRLADQVVDMEDGRAKILSKEEIQAELEHPIHTPLDAKVGGQPVLLPAEPSQAAGTTTKNGLGDEMEAGGVSLSVYYKYVKAGGLQLWAMLAVLYGLSRYLDISRARLLEAWGSNTAKTPLDTSPNFWGLPSPEKHPGTWLYVLGGLSGGQIVTFALAQAILAHICVNAAQRLFRTAVGRVSKATFRYHDITPTGQLKNRLVSDMGMVDGGILTPLESFIFNLIALSLSLLAIMSHQPYLLLILCVAATLFVYFFRIYVPISRCLRRMEMMFLTPIISNIGVMQDGLVTIRALKAESHFQDRHLSAVDDFQKQDHFFWSMAFWLDFRLSMSSACVRAALVLFMVWSETPASAIGFVLTQTTIAMMAVQQLCEKFAQLQLDAVSLERIDMLNRIPEEPTGGGEPPEDWPRPSDDVTFNDMSFRYAEHLPSVLRNVSFDIPGGSTCAVLGRTGSGKSTIANALLATELPCHGTVKIGAVDLSEVSRATLRNRVTFIQQDPILFPGTLRDNIDPEGRFSTEECQNAIGRVLGPGWGLETHIDAAGKNLSQGQRQLVSIGRAVLRRSGLVILDEATASVDRKTAATVQRILRDDLSGSTVITIAHRLEAVEDANWCLRLDHGEVVECGPANGSDLKGKSASNT